MDEKVTRATRKRKAQDNCEDTPKKKLKTTVKIKDKSPKPKKNILKKNKPKDDVKDINDEEQVTHVWDEPEMLSHIEKIPLKLAQNFIGLLTEGCTLPFIARYRKGTVDNLMPDR